MDWGKLLLFLGGIVLFCFVVYWIFHAFILSRILALATCALIFYLTFTHDLPGRIEIRWPLILLSTLAWQLYCGSAAFAKYLTGFIITDAWGSYVEEAGGFLANTAMTGIIMGLLYHFAAPNYPYFYYIIPGAITLLTIISFATGEPFGGD